MTVANGCSPSNPSRWEWRKIELPPKAAGQSAKTARRAVEHRSLVRREMRKPLTAVVSFRGGPEAWIQVKARGRTYRFPGWMAAVDVLQRIYEGDVWTAD